MKNVAIHRLENELLSVGIKSIGAELCSIVNKLNGKEYIWQGDPAFWASHAPVLFPIIGALKNDTYFFEGKEYHLPKHGFFRNNEAVTLKRQAKDHLTFSLKYSEDTLTNYPFKFEMEISFTLKEKTLEVKHTVFNLDDKPIYFSIGGHPAFNAPIFPGETYEDYYLEFDQDMELQSATLSEGGLISSVSKSVLENENKIHLKKDLFKNDALIFQDIPSKEVSLNSKNSGRILTVNYTDFKNLGIWAKPNAPYVCIEPWLGIADLENTDQDLKNKKGINKLMPTQIFSATNSIKIA
ncbi:galactose mutarotase-like enzyme [Gillisia mitskevichiae]|uniref:Galactose mutarotase-like enzyme n=1 Tax=Gillisia mitskevichiae TaxID=270921 RepID=A0A495PSJ4_9FLAO|nr:aldose 1-epimerase family protein [Gillisia mitskevichiae]RKS53491.1 galactose mutarotase-like enzyme [Gillisia mitskevichiae]